MGYNKTDSSGGLIRWAKSVRDRLNPNKRWSLLREKEKGGKDEEKNKTNIHNN